MSWRLLTHALILAAFFAVSSHAFDIEPAYPDTVDEAPVPPPKRIVPPAPAENIADKVDKTEPFADSLGVDRAGIAPASPESDTADKDGKGTPPSTFDKSIADAVDKPPVGITDTLTVPETLESVLGPVRRPSTRVELGVMSNEELFALAFGGAVLERPRNLIMTLIVEYRQLGTAELVFDEDFVNFRFISPRLSRYLDTLIVPAVRAAVGDSVGYFSSEVMAAAGYRVTADDRLYELRVMVPPDEKLVQHTNLKGGYTWTPYGEPVKPAFLSLYLNYTLSEGMYHSRMSYNWGTEKRTNEDFLRFPANLHSDWAFTAFRWTLEGTASLREPNEGQPFTWDYYRRGNVRLVREIVPWRARFTAGDISMHLGGGVVGGARYEYNKGFFGNDPRDGESSVSFFMPKPGQVEVYMDDVYRQRFSLPAGHHRISGFGGDIGRNSVRLVLRMEDGSTEEVPFEYVLGDPRNIRHREHRYSLAAGVRRESAPSPACFEYFPEEPAVSFDYMYGLSRWMSLGMTGLSSEYNNVAQWQILWDMGSVGWMNLYGGANYMPGAETPVGERIGASYTPNTSLWVRRINRRLGSDLDGRGGVLPNFSLTARGYYQTVAYNPNAFSNRETKSSSMAGTSGDLWFRLWRGGVGVNGDARFFRETDAAAGADFYPMAYSYGVRVSQNILRMPISASAGASVYAGKTTPYFSMNISHGFGVGTGLGGAFGRHRLSASASVGTGMSYAPLVLQEIQYPDSVRTDPGFDGPLYEIVFDDIVRMGMGGGAGFGWSWSNGISGNGAQSYSASASVPDLFEPSFPGMSASMQHTYNRANLSANYSVVNYSASSQQLSMTGQANYLSAVLSGSIMFADGLWAFGRPTHGSFALVEAKHNLKGSSINMNGSHVRGRGQALSSNGWLGAAYHNSVSAHYPTPLTLTLTEAPPGAILENNRFHALGGYKQGFALRLGSKDGVLMLAKIISGGRPVGYAYATIEPDGPKGDQDRRATFTGGDGTLQMGDLSPGKTYRIKFAASANIKDVLLTIPRGSELLFETEIEVDRVVSE